MAIGGLALAAWISLAGPSWTQPGLLPCFAAGVIGAAWWVVSTVWRHRTA